MKTKTWKVETGDWPFTQFIIDDKGGTVAKCKMLHYSTEDKTLNDVLKRDDKNKDVVADAKLISMAPALLENLIRCVDRLEENGFSDMSAVIRAKKAIDDATANLC